MMEANVIKGEIGRRRTVYDGCLEIGVESDIVLPDYCDDIDRILRCSLMPRVSSKRIEGQRLSVGGMAFMRMVYVTPDGRLSSFETQIPFSKSTDIQGDAENCTLRVRIATEYINCHAISKRRFEVRGALTMKAQVRSCAFLPVVTGIEDEGVEAKRLAINAVVPVADTAEAFTITEEYELDGAPISSVVRMTATAEVTDKKIVSGKMMIRGEIKFNIVYLSDGSDDLKNVSYSIPLNQVISVPGAEEGDDSDVAIEINRMSAEPVRRGDKNEISVEAQIEAIADVTRREQSELITDAYKIGCDSSCSFSRVDYSAFEQTVSKEHTVNISAEDGELIDIFADVKNVGTTVNEQGEVLATAEIAACLLIRKSDGEVTSEEKTVNAEFSLGADESYKNAVCDGDICIVSAQIPDGKNYAEIILSAKFNICRNESVMAVESMEIMPEAVKEHDPKTALTIYYADDGEDTFDIAKRYDTSAAAVMEENGLEDSVIKGQRRILIPLVR